MTTVIERVAEAIDAVQLFSRFNDWTTDRVDGLPIEICRYGADDEVVVIKRFPAVKGMDDALREVVSEHRARAALDVAIEHCAKIADDWAANLDTIAYAGEPPLPPVVARVVANLIRAPRKEEQPE